MNEGLDKVREYMATWVAPVPPTSREIANATGLSRFQVREYLSVLRLEEDKARVYEYIVAFVKNAGVAAGIRDIATGLNINVPRVWQCASALLADGLLEFRPRVGGSYYPTEADDGQTGSA